MDEDDYHPQPALVLQPDNQAGFVERVVADIRGKDLASFERVVGIDYNFMNVAPNVKSMKHMTYGKATESEVGETTTTMTTTTTAAAAALILPLAITHPHNPHPCASPAVPLRLFILP